MKVQYVGGSDALEITRGVIAVRDGDPVDVPDELGKELIDRGDFKKATSAAKRGKTEE